MKDLPDLLPDVAMLTRQWADTLCTHTDDMAGTCRPYHRAWTTLRLIGAISGARTDHEFFRRQFEAVAQVRPRADVLIVGTADHAMLHMVLTAFRARRADPQVTIVDRCATTLAANAWYAQQVCTQATTHQADLRDIDIIPGGRDVITTHSVFSFATPEEFTSLFRTLRGKLKSGGQLIFAQGLSPERPTGSRVRFTAEETLRFQQRALACFAEHGAVSGLDTTLVQELAHGFAVNKNIGAIAAAQDLLAPLSGTGFRLDHFEQAERSARDYRSSAPRQHERSISLRVVATRVD